jgi:SPP1 gp7 family putative phage head morphogenesis protein
MTITLNSSHPLVVDGSLVALIGVDSDNTIKDFVTPSRTLTLSASCPAIASGTYGRHFETIGSGTFNFFGLTISPSIGPVMTGDPDGACIFIAFDAVLGGNGTGGTGPVLTGYLNSSGAGLDMKYDPSTGKMGVAPPDASGSLVYSNATLSSGAHTFAVARLGDGTDNSRTYVDGVLDRTDSNTGVFASNNGGAAAVGGMAGQGYVNARFVYLAWFNRALTSTEISDLNSSLTGSNAFALVDTGASGISATIASSSGSTTDATFGESVPAQITSASTTKSDGVGSLSIPAALNGATATVSNGTGSESIPAVGNSATATTANGTGSESIPSTITTASTSYSGPAPTAGELAPPPPPPPVSYRRGGGARFIVTPPPQKRAERWSPPKDVADFPVGRGVIECSIESGVATRAAATGDVAIVAAIESGSAVEATAFAGLVINSEIESASATEVDVVMDAPDAELEAFLLELMAGNTMVKYSIEPIQNETIYLQVGKANKQAPINNERKDVKKNRIKMKSLLSKFFKKEKPALIKALSKLLEPVEKSTFTKALSMCLEPVEKVSAGKKKKIDAAVDAMAWEDLVPDAAVVIGSMTASGAEAALKSVGMEMPVPGPATQFAQDRSAELVGMKWVDGELVENPNAKWAITDSTREMIQTMTADAIDSGMSTDEFASMMEDSFAFSSERAEMIARTEMAMADTAGQLEGWKASEVVQGTEWTTAEDDAVSDECQLNADAGVVPLGELYPSGDAAPPAHPNCRCALIAALVDE